MKGHNSLSDCELKDAMARGVLDPGLFDHEAHLRWGWILLKDHGLESAIRLACNQLRKYTEMLGAADKYNETVTVAAIKAIHHFRQKSETVAFEDFIREFPRLKTSFKELMLFHYSLDIFENQRAKEGFIEPDLLPFN